MAERLLGGAAPSASAGESGGAPRAGRLGHALLAPAVVVPALHFFSGLSNSLPSTAYKLLMIDDARLEPQAQTLITGVVGNLPWDLKIVFAFLSDWIPICGRRRVPYLIIALSAQAVEKMLLDVCFRFRLFSP